MNNIRKMLKLCLILFWCCALKNARTQISLANPCPSLFKYFENNGVIFGQMEFPNDYSGNYRLSVNMSVAAYLGNNMNIRLELLTNANDIIRGASLTYNVYFPIQNVLPKPTRVTFNDLTYCSGPPEELRPGRYVTNMWATTFYKINMPFSRPRPNTDVDVTIIQEIPEELATAIVKQPTITTSAPFTNPPVVTKKPTVAECGHSFINAQTLVVNGEDVQDGQFPWLVALMYRENFDYKYRCTGSLVSDRHVVTAGHCLQYHKALLFLVNDLLLVLGKHNIQSWANGAVIRDVQSIVVHPDYEQNKGDGDIAIVTLTKAVEFQEDIAPVCLWQDREELDAIVGQEGTVVGWGRDETGRTFVPDAKKVNLPIVSQVECLRSDPGFASLTSSRTFCAGRRDGSGPCTGDSGAGFIINRNGRWTLRGVVSTALRDASTCDLNNYFVFVDAAKVKDWMNDVTK